MESTEVVQMKDASCFYQGWGTNGNNKGCRKTLVVKVINLIQFNDYLDVLWGKGSEKEVLKKEKSKIVPPLLDFTNQLALLFSQQFAGKISEVQAC